MWEGQTLKRSFSLRRVPSRKRHSPAAETPRIDRTDTYDASGYAKSPHVKQPPVGFEPTTCGLQTGTPRGQDS